MRKDDAPCPYCNEIINHRTVEKWDHFRNCIETNKIMVEGEDYVVCPICGLWGRDIGPHMVRIHQIPKDKRKELFPDLQIQCRKYTEEKDQTCIARYGSTSPLGNKDVRQKAIDTTRENYGVDNPFASSEVQGKIKSTNIERYGYEHPMQNEDVFCKQQASANASPNKLEQFFDEHTCDSIVFTGYGGRYIRTKTGVRKYNRVVKNLCPDFMIFQDSVLVKARDRSREKKKMDRGRHRTRYVIEILGDYYHSEEVIGVPTEEHEEEIIAAYDSVGIQCLTIWETDIVSRWNEIKDEIGDWISKAVSDINECPIYKKSTKVKKDKRKAEIICPLDSGIVFKTQEQLDRWKVSPDNLYRPELILGRDYVVCGECGLRFRKLGIHLARTHKMSEEDYLVLHPSAQIVASNEVDKISSRLKSKIRGSYQKRIAYRLPNGDIVRKKTAWKKAWGIEDPPKDTVLDASEIEIDILSEQIEGVDYVVCTVCGFKGKNIKRHVKKEHGLEGYAGSLKSEGCIEALSLAANKSWESRGRHDITKEILEKLLIEEGLTKVDVGKKLGVSGPVISYYCKKFGLVIPRRKKVEVESKKKEACGLDEVCLRRLYFEDLLRDSEIAEKFGITKDGVAYYRKKYSIKAMEERERIGLRAVRDGKKNINIVSKGEFIDLLREYGEKNLGEVFGCSRMLIRTKIRELDLEGDGPSDSILQLSGNAGELD